MSDLSVGVSYPRDWNNEVVPYGLDNIVNYPYLSIPTVDEAIEWLINEFDKKEEYFAYAIKKRHHMVYNNKIVYFCIIEMQPLNPEYARLRSSIYSAKKDLINRLIKIMKTYQK